MKYIPSLQPRHVALYERYYRTNKVLKGVLEIAEGDRVSTNGLIISSLFRQTNML